MFPCGGLWHLPAWSPQQLGPWVYCQTVCVPGPVCDGWAATCCPVLSVCLVSVQGHCLLPSHKGAPSHWPCCGCMAGGEVAGTQEEPPSSASSSGWEAPAAKPVALSEPLPSSVQVVLAPKAPGNKSESYCPAGQLSGSLITLDKRQIPPLCRCSVTKSCPLLQLCLILCNPLNCSRSGSSVHGILQARILEWVAMPSSSYNRNNKNS